MRLIYKAGTDVTEESKHEAPINAAGPTLPAPPLFSALAQSHLCPWQEYGWVSSSAPLRHGSAGGLLM